MKDQYFGDVNDYRKYGLLRVLCEVSGLPLGVCWMLTGSDSTSDGEMRSYLHQPSKWRHFDPELYDLLSRAHFGQAPRTVRTVEQSGLLYGATFQAALLVDDAQGRRQYFAQCYELFEPSEVVFLDPDNGIEVKSVPYGCKRSSKFVYWRELKELFQRGKSLIVYQHFPRVARDHFVAQIVAATRSQLDAPFIDTFATPHVLFLLVSQQHHREAFAVAHERIISAWRGQVLPHSHGTAIS